MDFLKRKQTNNVPNVTHTPEHKNVLPIEVAISTSTSTPTPLPSPSQSSTSILSIVSDETVINTQSDTSDQKNKIKINDILPKKIDQCAEPSLVDKKIEMKYIKDGRSHRTFVFNLELYIKKEDLNILINKMKKSFGTQCAYKETEFGFAYGFAGDLTSRIKQYLLDSRHVTPENFK